MRMWMVRRSLGYTGQRCTSSTISRAPVTGVLFEPAGLPVAPVGSRGPLGVGVGSGTPGAAMRRWKPNATGVNRPQRGI